MDEYSTGYCIRTGGRGGGMGTGTGTGTKCGRWNPTGEQVKVLTELFRSGLRTPTTEQIQKISAELSFYGKIESKNVFYWFQNHKARERQKRRRVFADQPSSTSTNNHHLLPQNSSCTTKQFGGEINEVGEAAAERERVIQTLQLFPVKSSSRFFADADHCKDNNNIFRYNLGMEMTMDHHPTLDLRLSFL